MPHLIKLLSETGFVDKFAPKFYRLTGPGLGEARRLVEMDRSPMV